MFIPSTDEEFVRRVLAQLAAAPAVQAEPGPDDWRRLIDKLARVRDAAPYVDGIGDHRWYYDAPVAEDAIEAIEARLGVALPADLRRFVRLFGDGAPGRRAVRGGGTGRAAPAGAEQEGGHHTGTRDHRGSPQHRPCQPGSPAAGAVS